MSSETDSLKILFKSFFDTKPSTFLVRGSPGSGKTTLVLELLNCFKDDYVGYYISTRVSLHKLQLQFPWIKSMLSEDNAISISPIDYRAGTLSSIMERIINILTKKRSFVILDSWDSIAKESERNERSKIEKALSMIADANESIVVFVSEEEKNGVEYLVDGIVTLVNRSANRFGLRSMYIDKMRGTLISYHKYYFTLYNSHFTLLSRDFDMPYDNPTIFDGIKSKEEYVSSGNEQLDNILNGGFKKGSIILLELEPDTNRRFLALFLASFVLNNIRNGGISFIISAADRPYTSTLKYIEPFCAKEDLKRLVFFTFEYAEEKEYIVKTLTNDLDKNHEIFTKTYTSLCEKNKIVITYDLGWYELRNENALNILRARLANTMRSIKKNGDVEIIINRSNLKSMPFSEVISDLHLKLWEEDGVPLLSIKKPYKGIYGLLEDKSKRYPAYILIPIA